MGVFVGYVCMKFAILVKDLVGGGGWMCMKFAILVKDLVGGGGCV